MTNHADVITKADHEYPNAETMGAIDAALISALKDRIGNDAENMFEQMRDEAASGWGVFFMSSGAGMGEVAVTAKNHGEFETGHALGALSEHSNNYHRLGLRVGDSHAALDACQTIDLAEDALTHLTALARAGCFRPDLCSDWQQARLVDLQVAMDELTRDLNDLQMAMDDLPDDLDEEKRRG